MKTIQHFVQKATQLIQEKRKVLKRWSQKFQRIIKQGSRKDYGFVFDYDAFLQDNIAEAKKFLVRLLYQKIFTDAPDSDAGLDKLLKQTRLFLKALIDKRSRLDTFQPVHIKVRP